MKEKTKSIVIIVMLLFFGVKAEEVRPHDMCVEETIEYFEFIEFLKEGTHLVSSYSEMVDLLIKKDQNSRRLITWGARLIFE